MAKRLYTNNANTTLAAPITNLQTTLSVVSGSGSLFPLPNTGAGQSFVITINKAGTTTIQEIMICTQRAGDILTVTRGAENTTALSWNAGDFVSLLPTAGDMALMAQLDDVQAQAGNYALDTGTVNAYVVSLTPALGQHIIGMPIRFKASTTNTSSTVTFNDGAGVGALLDNGFSPLLPGSIQAMCIYTVKWDGAQFELMDPITWGQTPAEFAGSLFTTTYNFPQGWSGRWGADPTGAVDGTFFLQKWLNAVWTMFYFQDGQGLWNGGGSAMPIATLQPGKYKVSASMTVPTGCTVAAMASPANTTNHTRLVMNSTGITPARTWTANTFVPIGANVQATAGGQLYYFRTNASGTTGATVPAWPTSGSVTDGGVTWTNQGLCTAGDNRNIPIFKLSRATHPGGNVLANQNSNSTFQWLELWSVTYGNTFNNPISTLGSSSPAYGDYPNGGAFFIDCDTVDARWRRCVFQNTPCGLNIQNVRAGIFASDGFINNGALSIFIEECEFDAASAHIIVFGSTCDITFRNCEFYDGVHQYIACTGKVVYDNCRWYGPGAHVDASDSRNSFTLFSINNCRMEQQNRFDNISIYGAAVVDIKANVFYLACTTSTIVLNNCSGGQVTTNSINDSGFQAAPTTGLGCTAAIKMIDCQKVAVTNNNLTATDASTYGGFGIVTLNNIRGSAGNFVSGNSVTATYNGAAYNGQGRSINLQSTDIMGTNYNANQWVVPKEGPRAGTRFAVPYSATMTLDASKGNSFDITFSNTAAWSLGISNPSEGQIITINLINNSGGNLGVGTFTGAIKISNAGTFTLANGGQLSFCLEYQGSFWYERWRAASPTPN